MAPSPFSTRFVTERFIVSSPRPNSPGPTTPSSDCWAIRRLPDSSAGWRSDRRNTAPATGETTAGENGNGLSLYHPAPVGASPRTASASDSVVPMEEASPFASSIGPTEGIVLPQRFDWPSGTSFTSTKRQSQTPRGPVPRSSRPAQERSIPAPPLALVSGAVWLIVGFERTDVFPLGGAYRAAATDRHPANEDDRLAGTLEPPVIPIIDRADALVPPPRWREW